MDYYFSPSNRSFYPAKLKAQYESSGSWPSDAVVAMDGEFDTFTQLPPDGKVLGDDNGRPAWVNYEAPPLSEEMIRALRTAAYRAESDHLKLEAEHDALLSGSEPNYTRWLEKVGEIKARYPHQV